MVGGRTRAGVAGLAGVGIALVVAVTALRGGAPNTTGMSAGPPPSGLTAHLEDELRPAVGDIVPWRTFWILCWDASPRATAYEVMTITGEGVSPRLGRQQDRCLRVEAAAGESSAADRLARRAAQLAVQQGQLAYRVRAVLPGGRPSAWSPSIAVGAVTDEGASLPRW